LIRPLRAADEPAIPKFADSAGENQQ
jgi:hypothetical protein